MTHWIDPTPVTIPASFEALSLHPLNAQALVRRGIKTREAAQAFLDPAHYTFTPPSELPGLSAAVDLVESAIRKQQPICVWGDFDVDGQTSTTILFQTLQELGADVTYHIPVRATESHGVKVPVLAGIIEGGARLILTCDTGISAHEAAEYARAHAVQFVISDHHDLPSELPHAAAITNPKLLAATHPLANLPGVGVAYKLSEALYARFDRAGEAEKHLDLVALGIVADLALLQGENRPLLQLGLESLRRAERLGLRVMCELAQLNPGQISEDHIGFTLGPRLNALGRLGDANPAVDLLTTDNSVRAYVLATQLEGLNAQRQLLTSQVTQAAEAQLREDPALLAEPAIVLGHPSWPGGVVGIVASRLVERYHKPVILFSTPEGEPAHGSARSVEGLHITQAIAAQAEMLLNFGGHPMAAGLSLEGAKIPEFRRALGRTVEKMLSDAKIEEAVVQIDDWLPLNALTLNLAAELEHLAPYGPGNPSLTLGARDLTLHSASPIGRSGEHLKLNVQDNQGQSQSVLWWGGAGEQLPEGKFDLAFSLRASDYRGTRQLTLELQDYRITEEKPVEIKAQSIETIDLRNTEHPRAVLAKLPKGILIWAEGEDIKVIRGFSREGLIASDTLAIWTVPPGPEVLRQALQRVNPQTVYLCAFSPKEVTTEVFINRLGGLAKYALNQRSGKVKLSELAVATAQREATVRIGLEWLSAGGHLTVDVQGSYAKLAPGDGVANQYLQKELFLALKGLLAETSAYRTHFQRAQTETLLQF